MHGLLITASESGGVDNPHAQPGAPLTLKRAFVFQLCDYALGTPLRAPKILRKLSDSGMRVAAEESERAGSRHILRV